MMYALRTCAWFVMFFILLTGCNGVQDFCNKTCLRPCQYCSIGRFTPQSCIDCKECHRACEVRHGSS